MPIIANSGLNVVRGFCFFCLKALQLLILCDNLKAAKVKFSVGENNLQESTSLKIKSDLKIFTYPA